MQEYFIRFVSMLNEGLRQMNAHYEMLAFIQLLPTATAEDREKFMQQLQWAAMHPDDILDSNSGDVDMNQVKELFRGL
jgi:hypothetical protein